jgi:streptogramin lyase
MVGRIGIAVEPDGRIVRTQKRSRWLPVAGFGAVVVGVAVVLVWASSPSASHSSLRIVPNSLLRVDARTGAPMVDLPVAPPDGTEFSGVPPHQVWVLSHTDEVVSVVDSRSNRRVATVGGFGLSKHGTGWALRYGAGSVWVATRDSSIARLDPRRRTLSGRIELPTGANLMAFGLNDLWAITYDHPNGLFRIDPKTNHAHLVAHTYPGVNGIAAGEGGVWLSNYPSNSVSKINPATGKDTLILLDPPAINPSGIGLGFGYAWVANSGLADQSGVYPQTVTRINPTTNQQKTIKVCAATPSVVTDVVEADGSLWMTCPTAHRVARINPTTLRVTHFMIHTTGVPTEITSANGSLWIMIETHASVPGNP